MLCLPQKLAFVDIETTGGNFTHDRIIEVGIVRVENNKIVKTFQSLVNPQEFLPLEITYLTGITAAQLERAPTFRAIKSDLQELLNDCIFVAHNARFDLGFLKSEFKRLHYTFSPKHLCTVKLSRLLYPRCKHHNLDAIIKRHTITCAQRHRAFDDASVLWEFYQKILNSFTTGKIAEAVQFTLRRPSKPIYIQQKVLDGLPEQPGVYIFYDSEGMPLYIGKSLNVKTRILSHFSSDYISPREMKISQYIRDIEVIKTAGELGALLTESDLIKKQQPLYNRKLRQTRQMIIAKEACTMDGYSTLILEEISSIHQETLYATLGVFKNKLQAKQHLSYLAREFNLCDKLLGLQKCKDVCFGYSLKRCLGACVHKEESDSYNQRFQLAFAKTRISLWPFTGPILIKEQNPHSGLAETFLIDQWCYLGRIIEDVYGQTQFKPYTKSFDFDMYTIIKKYVKNPSNKRRIQIISEIKYKMPEFQSTL